MATQTITIRVSPEAARVYNTATAEQQRKLEALLSLKLTEVARTTRPLEEIMSEMSRNAQARGLTRRGGVHGAGAWRGQPLPPARRLSSAKNPPNKALVPTFCLCPTRDFPAFFPPYFVRELHPAARGRSFAGSASARRVG